MKKRVNKRKSVKKRVNKKKSVNKRVKKKKCEQESERKKDQEVNYEKGRETKRKESFFIKDSELKSAFYSNKPMFVLLYKETLLNNNGLDSSLSSVVSSLL